MDAGVDVLRCDGRTAESVRRLGDVPGHMVPGAALAGWGLHLFLSAAWRHVLAERDPSASRFTARTWEPLLPFLPWRPWRRISHALPLDPLFKALMGGCLVIFAFPFNQIVCTDGVRPGRIVGQHIVRWAHSTLITSYAMIGAAELLSFRVRFPAGGTTAAMVVSHTVSAVIFVFHMKHEALDQMAHGLLGYCFLGAAAFGVMEVAQPHSFMALCGKLYCHILGGLWLAIVGHIVFGRHVFWAADWDGQPDVNPTMFVPIVFALTMLGLCFAMMLLYAAVDLLGAWALRSGWARQRLLIGPCEEPPAGDLGQGLGLGHGFAVLPRREPQGGGEESQGLLARRGGESEAPLAASRAVEVQLGCSAVGSEGRRAACGKAEGP